MTTTTATQSEETGQRRTNRWTKTEELWLISMKEDEKLPWKVIALKISSYRNYKGSRRPSISYLSAQNKYVKLKRKQKQNESNIKR